MTEIRSGYADTTRGQVQHLTELWQRRQKHYPPGRPDLLSRFVRDALVLGDELPDLRILSSQLNNPTVAVIDRGMIPLMEHRSSEVCELIVRFLS
ncbi:hypothetical protein [Actinomadura sp. 6N118]|uniref:hypothetical protein n=1 Tax=Actinomadura sp. 6N118 TaxID=3375151 RepID=UPI0037AC5410